MQRVAFLLKLRPGAGEAYDKAHKAVWPEMLELLQSTGVHEYSIFRRDELLFLYMRVDDFEQTWSKIEQSPVNTRWQKAMSEYFAPLENELRHGERFPMMREVFYLP